MDETCLDCEVSLACIVGAADYYQRPNGRVLITFSGDAYGNGSLGGGHYMIIDRHCPGLRKKLDELDLIQVRRWGEAGDMENGDMIVKHCNQIEEE